MNVFTFGRIFKIAFVLAYFCNRIPKKYHRLIRRHFNHFFFYIDDIDNPDMNLINIYTAYHTNGYIYISHLSFDTIERIFRPYYDYSDMRDRVIFSPDFIKRSPELCKLLVASDYYAIDRYDEETRNILKFHTI